MRLVIARCSVDYAGRLSAHLPEAVAADHGQGRRLRRHPRRRRRLQAAELDERAEHARRPATTRWIVTNPKGERLTITLHEVLSGLVVGPRRRPRAAEGRRRGPPPGAAGGQPARHRGRACASCAGSTRRRSGRSTSSAATAPASVVAIEVKRRGEIDGVEQLARYIERLHLDSSLGDVRGVFVAQVVKPQARVLAEARGFRWVEVDYDALRGLAPDDLRLF